MTCVDPTNRTSIPLCACKSHYYDDNTITCKICNHKCLDCETNSTTCKSCQGADRLTLFPACVCDTGFFDDGSNSDCESCDYECGTCVTAADDCDTCSDSNRSKDNSTGVCTCDSGWFD